MDMDTSLNTNLLWRITISALHELYYLWLTRSTDFSISAKCVKIIIIIITYIYLNMQIFFLQNGNTV